MINKTYKPSVIAIVGASIIPEELLKNTTEIINKLIERIINKYGKDTLIISGGAKGVDTLAHKIAMQNNLTCNEYVPTSKTWEAYKERNIKIAQNSDFVFCVAMPYKDIKCYHHTPSMNHQKTAGCYTCKYNIHHEIIVVNTEKSDAEFEVFLNEIKTSDIQNYYNEKYL